jgi:integrase
LMDVILVGALTGARLDAVVDLKVQDISNGTIRFKAQKKEPAPRHVPIHPDLEDLVVRRVAGKRLDDDFFPEWPAPKEIGSQREKSFKTSTAFTAYRRQCGVDERVPGQRRSLVNFHSFRRWFITKAERAGFDRDLIAAIVGHKREGHTFGTYSEGPEMKRARRCVAAIKLPPLDKPVPQPQALMPRRKTTAKG